MNNFDVRFLFHEVNWLNLFLFWKILEILFLEIRNFDDLMKIIFLRYYLYLNLNSDLNYMIYGAVVIKYFVYRLKIVKDFK